MKSTNIHYEVLGQRGSAWTILAVVDSQDEAMKTAKDAQASYRAVKVMRERFDKSSNTYRSGQIYFHGAQAKPSKFDNEEMPSVCWKVEDFYSYEGRRAINRLLRTELTEWGVTATELIHSPTLVQQLQDTGTAVQRAVQQTAIAQIRETGQGVQERIKQIYELVDKATKQLNRDAPAFPTIGDDGLDGLIPKIADKESRSYLLHGALAAYLARARDFNAKMSHVLGMVRADHPDWVHEVVDTFVAELLSMGKGLHILIGERENAKEEMLAAAELSEGRADGDDRLFTADARMVNRLILAGKMPCTQQSLVRYLIETMKGKRALAPGGPLEEGVAVTQLVGKLRRPGEGGWIGQIGMVEAVGKRCGRWLHPEGVAEFLGTIETPDGKVARLLDLEKHVFGNANKRKLGEFISPIITSPQGEVYLTSEAGTVTERLKRLRQLQARVLASELQDMHRRKLAMRLDDLNCRVVRSARLIERMSGNGGNAVEKCFSLLRLMVDRYFTIGNSENMARDAIRRILARPDFTAAFLDGANTKDEKMRKLEALSTLLRQAGIDMERPVPVAEPVDADDNASTTAA